MQKPCSRIREGDLSCTQDAAEAFCKRHNLADDVIEPLTQHLRNELTQQEPAEFAQTETEAEELESLCTDADASYADPSYADLSYADAAYAHADYDDPATAAEADDWEPAALAAPSRPRSTAPSTVQQPSFDSRDDEPSHPFEHHHSSSSAILEDGEQSLSARHFGQPCPRPKPFPRQPPGPRSCSFQA